jgi:hypothetical protein
MIQEIINFVKIQNTIEPLLNESVYNKKQLIKNCGFTAPTFYKKIKEKSFTPAELLKLSKYLAPKEYYKYELEQEIRLAELDIANNNVKPVNEVLNKLRQKLI